MSIKEIAYSNWMFFITLSSKDREWTHSTEIFNQGLENARQHCPFWLNMHTCHGWLPLQLVSLSKAKTIVWLGNTLSNTETPYPTEDQSFSSCSMSCTVLTLTPWINRGIIACIELLIFLILTLPPLIIYIFLKHATSNILHYPYLLSAF